MQRYFQPFGMLLIFTIGWIFTLDIAQHVDLLFWDEANYMASGMSMFDKFNKAWGPTYAFWYKFLSFFEGDSIKLYYLNYRLMTILPAIALFILLLQSNVRRWAALWVALLLLFAQINLPVWPKVSHYSIFVLLMGLVVMRRIKIYSLKLTFMAYVVLFLAYSRPEVFLTYLGIIVLWLIVVSSDRASRRPIILAISIAGLLGTVLIQYVIGNPMFTFHGNRSAIAFAQHFMMNYYQWNGIDQDFWITWMPYYQKEFGNAASISEAYKMNAPLLQKHIFTNIHQYFYESFRLFTDAMLPEKLIQIPLKIRIIILSMGGAIAVTIMGKKAYVSALRENILRNMLVIMILLLFVAPSVAACIVIYPREHYLLLQLPLILLLVTIFFFSRLTFSEEKSFVAWIIAGLLALLCFIKMPSLAAYDYFDLWRKENSLANLKTVEKIRSYNFGTPVRILENEGGINLFLKPNFIWIRGFTQTKPVTEFIKTEQIQMIYVTPSLTNHSTFRNDSTWPQLAAHPENFGFVKVKTGEHQPYLLIEKELLNSKIE